MSVLLKHEIIEAINKNKITSYEKKINLQDIESKIGVNSIDVTLGNKLKTYIKCDINEIFTNNEKCNVPIINDELFSYIDIKAKNEVYELEIPEEGLILMPGILYLGHTNEALGSKYHIPMYEGRSSMARLGIQSHISAGFGDIGFDAQWTLEITVMHPTKIYPNTKIGQVFFMKIDEKESRKAMELGNFYKGKYVHQKGAQESKSFLDF